MTTIRNERGIALLIVLMIVALLTIIVTEFTYSVELDQHRARHALHALQAQLLARSGANIAEAFLVQDAEPKFDAYTEDWWIGMKHFCDGLEIDPTVKVVCAVEDESGKINVNGTRTSQQSLNQPPGQRTTKDAYLRAAVNRIFNNHNIPTNTDREIQEILFDYWQEEPPPGWKQMPPFSSVEDFAAKFEVPTRYLPRLRRLLTTRSRTGININTAPDEVLAAVFSEVPDADDAVQQVVQQRAEQPFENTSQLRDILQNAGVKNASVVAGLFGVQSRFYRLEASAIANVDPGSGARPTGVGQTVELLVERRGGARNQGSDLPLWTVRPVDWQREGGARLMYERSQEEKDEGDEGDGDGLDPLADAP